MCPEEYNKQVQGACLVRTTSESRKHDRQGRRTSEKEVVEGEISPETDSVEEVLRKGLEGEVLSERKREIGTGSKQQEVVDFLL